MGTQLAELWGPHRRTRSTRVAPTHQVGKGGGAAAACGLGHHTSGWVDTLAFSVHSIAEALNAVAACAPIWPQREACQALALETTICICALSTLAGVA